MDDCRKTRFNAKRLSISLVLVVWILSILACSKGYVTFVELTATAISPTREVPSTLPPPATPTSAPTPLPTRTPEPTDDPLPTPSKSPSSPEATTSPLIYYSQAGDTLPAIANRFGVGVKDIQASTDIPQTGLLSPGVLLIIPDVLGEVGPGEIIMPDSEVVFSPSALDFNIQQFVQKSGGYLLNYTEWLSTGTYTGSDVIYRVAIDNSINPRLLLALLDFKSNWVRGQPTNLQETEYPMANTDFRTHGLYRQLSWTVQQLAIGYYGWRNGLLTEITFPDGSTMRINPMSNAGSVALQYLFSKWYNEAEWYAALFSPQSLPQRMDDMFGNPWLRAQSVEPLYPITLKQPLMELPFQPSLPWSLIAGPHSAWGPDGALAALDFGPPSTKSGCEPSQEWVTAMAPGVVVRSESGLVAVDLDGDGYEQTGWAVIYLHIASQDRIPVGTMLETNDKIGHPSCEGGVAMGTHVHISRKFNGEWILADGPVPFTLSGCVAHNGTRAYLGSLVCGDKEIIANDQSNPSSLIQRLRSLP